MKVEVQQEIDLVRGWFEGHPDSAVIEELAARFVTARAENARLTQELAGLRELAQFVIDHPTTAICMRRNK